MRQLIKIIGLFVAFALLSSCLVTKEYQQPDIVEQENFRTDSITSSINEEDSNTIASISWNELFTDSHLQKYVDNALQNNVSMQIALEQIKAATAYVKQGKAAYYPSVSAGLDYRHSILSENGQQGALLQNTGNNRMDLFELSGSLSWEADIWGKITSNKRAMEANYLQSVAATRVIQTELVARIASTYYHLLAIDKEIKVVKETIQLREKSWKTTQSLNEVGMSGMTSIAVKQTKAQYLAAKTLLIDLKKQAHLLENTLCILMGESPHPIERSSLDEQEINTPLKVGVPLALLGNRPDVQAAELNYRYAFEMTNVARANFYPSLTIGLSGGLQSLDITNWFSLNSLFANIVGGIMAPIFNRRTIRTQYEVSEIQQKQAQLNYKEVLLQASKEVSDALYNYDATSKKITIQQEQEELLQEAVIGSQKLLESGYNNVSYLDVLTAQSNALSIRMLVIQTRVEQLTSMVELYRALGGGTQ